MTIFDVMHVYVCMHKCECYHDGLTVSHKLHPQLYPSIKAGGNPIFLRRCKGAFISLLYNAIIVSRSLSHDSAIHTGTEV